MLIRHETRKYSIVSADITNRCNARCKFCFNDWSTTPKKDMDEATFRKLLEILPFTQENGFYFSCLYEPSIHPEFLDLLETIPKQFADRVFLTTNLMKRLEDADILRLAQVPVNHINISLETFQPDRYKKLTGVELENSAILDNLARIARIFPHFPQAPKICVLTMILKSNYDELIDIAVRAHEELHPYQHEFRIPYYISRGEEGTAYIEDELLTRRQIDQLTQQLKVLDYGNLVWDDRQDIDTYHKHRSDSSYEDNMFSQRGPYNIRINSDGVGVFKANDQLFDLTQEEQPFSFFANHLIQLQKLEAETYKTSDAPAIDYCDEGRIAATLDGIVVYDRRFAYFLGWAFQRDATGAEEERYLILSTKSGRLVYKTTSMDRRDVSDAHGDPSLLSCGFECTVDLWEIAAELEEDVVVNIGIQRSQGMVVSQLGVIERKRLF